MRIASVRDVQHHLKELLSWVAAGQSVDVTLRGKVVARIVPPNARKAPAIPDFLARMSEDFPEGIAGKPLSQIIDEGREDAR